ncbi:unnamed protein product [Moneuplotes crassus]|uniref:Uncharacterized protein n=1 Tax=Euplotes crassus TaxID=5936 RepID=A0AAD1UFC9_EUPCR|nr:unnamed protein product [Moneuplotes crassus]
MSQAEYTRDRDHPFEKSVKFQEEAKNKITESPIMKASPCEIQQENINTNLFHSKHNRRESHPMTMSSLLNPMQSARKSGNNPLEGSRPPLMDLGQDYESKLFKDSTKPPSSEARIESNFVEQMKTALDFNKTKNEMNDLKEKIYFLEEEIQDLQTENARLMEDRREQENVTRSIILNLEREIQSLKEANSSTSKSFEDQITHVEEKAKLDCTIKSYSIKVLKDEISELSLKLTLKDQEIMKIQQKANGGEGAGDKIKELQQENDQLKREMRNISQARENEKNVVREQIAIFRQELNKLRQKSDDEVRVLRAELESLTQTLQLKNDNILSLTNQLDQAKENLREEAALVPEITSIDEIHTRFSKDTYHEPNTFARVGSYTLQKVSYIIDENIVLKKECQVLILQLNQQREEYEEKFKRREAHLKKDKEQRERSYNELKKENMHLKNQSMQIASSSELMSPSGHKSCL